MTGLKKSQEQFPLQTGAGFILITVFWFLSWFLEGLRSNFTFFPLWLGYVLMVDGLVETRRGSSLLKRNPRAFIFLFFISAPAWWLFELINVRTGNWIYLGRERFSDLEYALLASLSFSTVIPAVFETAELMADFPFMEKLRNLPAYRPTPRANLAMFMLGWVMLGLLLLLPGVFFPLVWVSVYFIIEPVNAALNRPSLLNFTAYGNYAPAASLALGALVCGFFWEMWNFLSYPKWIYSLPDAVEFGYIFEMPVLGYLGYLPFALELFAIYHFSVFAVQKITGKDIKIKIRVT